MKETKIGTDGHKTAPVTVYWDLLMYGLTNKPK